MYSSVFNQSFQTCRHYFLIIINDKGSDFTTTVTFIKEGERKGETYHKDRFFSHTYLSDSQNFLWHGWCWPL